MERKLTIKDIAERAFVSRSVVSRVLNDHPGVSDEARARVMQVIKKYNYTPSATARSLATARTHEICLLAPRKRNVVFANGYWPLLFLGVAECCLGKKYHLSLSMLSADMEEDYVDHMLFGHNFDGYILITKEVAELAAPAIVARKKKAVMIGHAPSLPDLPSVDIDNFGGAYLATSHLLGLGHRRIATITGHRSAQEADDRLEGYRRALADAGLSISADYCLDGDFSHRSGFNAARVLMALPQPPTAVVCASDAMAKGVLLGAQEQGLTLPDDLAVVGFDDLPDSKYTSPPLSTIRQPIYHMGEAAASMLIGLLEGKNETPTDIKLSVALVVRRSCGGDPKQEPRTTESLAVIDRL